MVESACQPAGLPQISYYLMTLHALITIIPIPRLVSTKYVTPLVRCGMKGESSAAKLQSSTDELLHHWRYIRQLWWVVRGDEFAAFVASAGCKGGLVFHHASVTLDISTHL